MSIADKITSIETHLQADWESIENLGGSAEDKNIENIATSLNEIYDNLPKTTGEDTSLSLTTLKGKMNTTLKGDTQQDGTPTPSTPIDIEVVTGTQEVKVENVNLLDISKFEEHYTIDSNGLPAYNAGQTRLTNTTPINVSGIEKVTLTCTLNGKSFIYSLLDSDNTLISRVAGNPSGTTITIGQAKYLYICFYDNATLSTITDAMLVKGTSTSTPYTPHQEQTQIVELSSKNLIDISKVTTTNTTNWTISISDNTLSITHNNSYNTGYPTLELGKLKNGTYVLSGTLGSGIGLYKDSTYQSILNSGSTFTCNGNEDIRLTFPTASFPSGTTLTYVNMQLEKGSTPTTYEQYYNIELCKIGNYQDYLYKSNDKWYKKEYIGKKVFTGASSEDWGSATIGTYRTFMIGFENYLRVNSITCCCNYYKAITNGIVGDIGNYQCRFRYYADTSNMFYISNDDIADINSFKTWLSTHNTEVYYVLATPQDIEITNTNLVQQLENLQKLKSYNGVTNINCSGNLSAILSVSALKGE